MAKIRKIMAITLIAVTLLTICVMIAGCGDDGDRLQQVSFKVRCYETQCPDGTCPKTKDWIIPKGENELYIEQEYDGKEYEFKLISWERIDSKYPSGFWLSEYINQQYYSLWKEGDPKENVRETVCEKGNYVLTIYTRSEKWYPQILRVYISVI